MKKPKNKPTVTQRLPDEPTPSTKRGHGPTRPVRVPISMISLIKRLLESDGGIPYFSDRVPAGFPSPAEGELAGGLNIVARMIPHPEAAFLLLVTDETLRASGIASGDILVVRTDLTPKPGDLVVAEFDGRRRVRRLIERQGRNDLVEDEYSELFQPFIREEEGKEEESRIGTISRTKSLPKNRLKKAPSSASEEGPTFFGVVRFVVHTP